MFSSTGRGTDAAREFAAAALAVALVACHPQVRPMPAVTTASPTETLHHDIDEILAEPTLAHGIWGVLVKSLKNDDTLYDLNARKLFVPASNMKIVTLAAAAERLGWDYTYETRLLAAGRVDAGRLDGDLVVAGSGDPSIGYLDGSADRLFDDWAAKLKAAGIQTVSGRLIGDDNAFDDEELGFGWSWDDLPDDYAAGVSALQFNENAVRLTIAPGPSVGSSAGISLSPSGSGLLVDSTVTTSARDAAPTIAAHRLPGSARLELRGTVPLGSTPQTRAVSVDNPTLFFVGALRTALISRGIDVRGPSVDVDDVADRPSQAAASPIATHRSAPLSQLALRLMKDSQNLYAETFLKTLGLALGTPTYAAGRTQVQLTLGPWGIGAGDLIQRDGSGLSRYDFVTPAALVTILTHIARDERLHRPFEASLPIGGRDGSLTNRMKGNAAEGNVRAKTGSMTSVRSLSGYVTTAAGEPLVFSIMANNFDTPPATINAATDAIVVRLASLRR